MSAGDALYVGIDVGTGSARAGIFDARGKRLGMGVCPIQIFRPQEDFVEQSSEDIWRSCGKAVALALREAQMGPADTKRIQGIGFDATCSLVLLDQDDRPVTASPTGNDEQNIIVWMDHRAMDETAAINATGHDVLKYVGGTISPEMETPKLLWLKKHLPKSWSRTARFFDLPDFLTYRATGIDTRSLCTTVCKWTYLGHEGAGGRWDESYFKQIGLGDLADSGFARIGKVVRPMGEKIGGLTPKAAEELGLTAGTPVGVSIIDAHAGGLGLLGVPLDGAAPTEASLEQRLALIGGTSSCHMAVSVEAKYIPGIWGPYRSAMVPGMWLTEGGQSATGALIDHTIHSHARGRELADLAKAQGKSVYALLNARLSDLADREKCAFPGELTRELHVLPDHHGNRSPRANPTLRGMISGPQAERHRGQPRPPLPRHGASHRARHPPHHRLHERQGLLGSNDHRLRWRYEEPSVLARARRCHGVPGGAGQGARGCLARCGDARRGRVWAPRIAPRCDGRDERGRDGHRAERRRRGAVPPGQASRLSAHARRSARIPRAHARIASVFEAPAQRIV